MNILILADGVAGHNRQCEAIAHELHRLATKRYPNTSHTTQSIHLNVKFVRPFLIRAWFRLTHPLVTQCPGCNRCMRYYLDRSTLNQLKSIKADFVISAFGKRAVDVAYWLSKRNHAKSIVLMTPRQKRERFDLIIVPRHDPYREKNMLITEGAPNITRPEANAAIASRFIQRYGSGRTKRIGLLLGGDYKQFKMSEQVIKMLIDQLEKYAQAQDVELWISTSRRTRSSICNLIKQRFSDHPNVALLVVASENNEAGVVSAILGACQAVIVSPESISMVSEAASAGIHVMVFDDEDFLHDKHKRFIHHLSKESYVRLFKPEELFESLNRWNDRVVPQTKRLRDDLTIEQALQNLLALP